MMNSVRLLPLLIAASLVAGCAQAPVKPSPAMAKNAAVIPAAPSGTSEDKDFDLLSEREMNKLSRSDCPKSLVAWKQSPWKKLVHAASSCVAYQQWAQLDTVAKHLSVNFPERPWGFYFLSLGAEQKSNYAKSMWMIEQALQKNPTHALFVYQKARLLWKMEDKTEALNWAERAVSLNSRFQDARLFLAELNWTRDDLDEAIAHLEVVLREEPRNKTAVRMMADATFRSKKFETAETYLQRLIQMEPTLLWPRARLASLQEDYKKSPEMALMTYRNLNAQMKRQHTGEKLDFNVDQKISELEKSLKARDVTMREPAKQKGAKK